MGEQIVTEWEEEFPASQNQEEMLWEAGTSPSLQLFRLTPVTIQRWWKGFLLGEKGNTINSCIHRAQELVSWVQTPALPLTGCKTWASKATSLSECAHLQRGDNNSISLTDLL